MVDASQAMMAARPAFDQLDPAVLRINRDCSLRRVFDLRVSVENVERNGVAFFHRLDDVDVLGGYLAVGRTDRMVYYAFDLLHLDGFDLRAAALVNGKGSVRLSTKRFSAWRRQLPGISFVRPKIGKPVEGRLRIGCFTRMTRI